MGVVAVVDPAAVLSWGLPRLRDLPWRRTRDPWAVLVSEVMLQQTQVTRVIPKWQAFMAEYPTTAACAAAKLGDVLRLWQGLGYPRRARNLHDAATAIESRRGFPRTVDELRQLPGVGAYTARAVMAFAFELDAAVVDTNIARVYARVAGRRLTASEVQRIADAGLPSGEAWAWNQSLMDLGSTLCRPVTPSCAECPLHSACAWRGRGDDPARGSAGVSRAQAPFDGSDRQARGRLLKALGSGQVTNADAALIMHRSAAAADVLVESLMADGLVVRDGATLRLP